MINQGTDSPTAFKPISDREFSLFQRLIYDAAGIHLAPHKKALLEARLSKHIRQLGLDSFGAYYERVVNEQRSDELIRMLDRVSTNETHFFRESRQLEFLASEVFAKWQRQADTGQRGKRIALWSAGCSTGEEPFTLAMLLYDHFPPEQGWQLAILATDLSTRVLESAASAIWPIAKADEIPEKYLKRFMLRGTGSQQGNMKAVGELAALVRFERLNLNDDHYPITGPFDAIFCRNVLIYFDGASRRRVIDRLLDQLSPDGYLFVGHAESLNGVTERARHVMPTIYKRVDEASLEPARRP
jgi:chemotaxis protein methyltransferase CheR